MADPYVGEIRLFSFEKVPSGWAVCDGSELQISQNTALYALIGMTYGGNGRTTFCLPDLRGRVAVGAKSTQNNLVYSLGYTSGSTTVTLTLNNIPLHTHALQVSTATGNTSGVANGVYGSVQTPSPQNLYAPPSNPSVTLASNSLQPTGGSSPHSNLQPYAVSQYCIALLGVYPPRP